MLDDNPKIAAKMLDDVRVVKMITESAQMLSTAHRILDGRKILVHTTSRNRTHWELPEPFESNLYKVAYRNHPCNIWIRETTDNYQWLFDHFVALAQEYTLRYGKKHKSSGLIRFLLRYPLNIMDGPLTFPALAMPEEYKSSNFVESYRSYFNGEKLFPKKRPASWKNNEIPSWVDTQKLTRLV